MKERYLLDIKNAMFWHFTSSEIKDTLEELNTYFQSARNNGITDTAIIQEYGSPADFAKELLDEPGTSGIIRKPAFFIKSLFLALYTIFTLLSFLLLPLHAASCVFVMCCPFFIWFLAGNTCILPVLENTAAKKQLYARNQVLTLLLFLFLQLSSYLIVPSIADKGYIVNLGRPLSLAIYLLMVFLLLSVLISLKKMLDGNIYMFYIVIQDISIITSLFLYLGFLKNAETTENLEYIFTPCLICIPVLLGYWIYTKNIIKQTRKEL
ncbi:MAG: hypothetical protein HFH68_05595 [Lachnospiraceae bacterium]|nr:hypothetical protein [Lachnospiraceae bacterium]